MKTTKRAQCGRKQKHKSKGAAEAALRSLERLEPDAQKTYTVYPCPFRGRGDFHWHIGHRGVGNVNSKYAEEKKGNSG